MDICHDRLTPLDRPLIERQFIAASRAHARCAVAEPPEGPA